MQIDDLRSELATLADEMAPFEGDVSVLHRRARRRRVVMTSITAVFVLVLVVSTATVARRTASGKVHVAGVPSKEVSPDEISHIDAIVVPATAAVKDALDASPLVGQYARIPAADRSSSVLFVPNIGLCALQTRDGYAVDVTSSMPVPVTSLLRLLDAQAATYYDVHDQIGFDVEVFAKVQSPTNETAAIRSAIDADPDVQSMQYISKTDAYDIFKKDFADQPSLVQSTKPSDLPESFRIIVKPGRSVASVAERYKHLAWVDTTLTPALTALFVPPGAIKDSGKHFSPCAKP